MALTDSSLKVLFPFLCNFSTVVLHAPIHLALAWSLPLYLFVALFLLFCLNLFLFAFEVLFTNIFLFPYLKPLTASLSSLPPPVFIRWLFISKHFHVFYLSLSFSLLLPLPICSPQSWMLLHLLNERLIFQNVEKSFDPVGKKASQRSS